MADGVLSQNDIDALLDEIEAESGGEPPGVGSGSSSGGSPQKRSPALPTATGKESASTKKPPGRLLTGLLDLPVRATVRLAGGVRRIGDILEFLPGSVVEMDDPVNSLVEISVNGQVLARGEIVVVDGFYGVHIKEVVSPRERLQKVL